MSSLLRLLSGLLLLGTSALLHAQSIQINWGTAVIEQKMITSDGLALDPNEFEIEIGYFDSGFIPTADNVDQWLDHWVVFDAKDYHINNGNDITGRYGGSEHLFSGSGYEGQQAYVFIREITDYGFYGGVEWALYTNDSTTGTAPVEADPWVFPTVSPTGQGNFPENWYISSADTAVVGAVGDETAGVTDVGGGSFTDTSEDFVVRTHLVIPEPHFGLLFGSLGVLLLLRRLR